MPPVAITKQCYHTLVHRVTFDTISRSPPMWQVFARVYYSLLFCTSHLLLQEDFCHKDACGVTRAMLYQVRDLKIPCVELLNFTI